MQSFSQSQDLAIGIDLGTTNCCIAIYHGLQKETIVIPNDLAKNTTPSYVAYGEDDEISVGEAAKNLAHENPENTIFDMKRLIGRFYDDPQVQKYIHLWPFHVTNYRGQIGLKVKDKTEAVLPEDIYKELISYLIECAQSYLRRPIKSAVVTVPAYFTQFQRRLTKEACELAGLERIHLISEPTAASLAYSLQQDFIMKFGDIQDKTRARSCLIFDLGGGTFDVAVLRIVPDNESKVRVQIKAIGGDPRLGGGDFDELLLQYCINQFKKLHGIDLAEGKDSVQDPKLRFKIARRLRRIRKECEKQKCYLSQAESVVISLDAIHGEIDLAIPVTREVFQDLINEYLERCIDIVDGILEESGIGWKSIDDVVMIGGSSRIPKVQEMVSEYFGGKTLYKAINGDEAVACGAAVHAYNIFNANLDPMKQVVVEKPEMLGYYAAIDDTTLMASLEQTNEANVSPQTADPIIKINIPHNPELPPETSYSPIVEEMSFRKTKLIIHLGQTNVHFKLVEANPHRTIRHRRTSTSFEVKCSKNILPYLSWTRFNQEIILIGKEAERFKFETNQKAFNVMTLLREKVSELFRMDSFIRLSTEMILGKFFEIAKKKLMTKANYAEIDVEDMEHVIIYGGNMNFKQNRCLLLASVLAGFSHTRIVPFSVAQTTAIMVSPTVSNLADQVLILHYTWSVFEVALVTWVGSGSGSGSGRKATVSGCSTSQGQQNETDFLFFHAQLMNRVLNERAKVHNEALNPCWAHYRSIIGRALSSTHTSFSGIQNIFVIFEENCGSMRNILWRNLGKKLMTGIEETHLMFEPDFTDYMFYSSGAGPGSGFGSKRRCDAIPHPPDLMEQRLRELLQFSSQTLPKMKPSKPNVCQGTVSFHRNGVYEVITQHGKELTKTGVNETVTDEDGIVSKWSMQFQVSQSQNGLFSINHKMRRNSSF